MKINDTCVISAIIVPVANPDAWNAFVVVAFELILRTNFRRTVHLVLASRTVDVVIAFLVRRKTETGNGAVALALELLAEAGVVVAVLK